MFGILLYEEDMAAIMLQLRRADLDATDIADAELAWDGGFMNCDYCPAPPYDILHNEGQNDPLMRWLEIDGISKANFVALLRRMGTGGAGGGAKYGVTTLPGNVEVPNSEYMGALGDDIDLNAIDPYPQAA